VENNTVKNIGIISDTHGHLNNKIFEIFSNVDLIIHAGDIGNQDILVALRSLAPVNAVYGNTDRFELRKHLKFLLNFDLLGYTFIVTHMPIKLDQINFDRGLIKVFGHTHFAEIKAEKDSLVINPGSAGIPQTGGKHSVAVLELSENSAPRAEIIYFK